MRKLYLWSLIHNACAYITQLGIKFCNILSLSYFSAHTGSTSGLPTPQQALTERAGKKERELYCFEWEIKIANVNGDLKGKKRMIELNRLSFTGRKMLLKYRVEDADRCAGSTWRTFRVLYLEGDVLAQNIGEAILALVLLRWQLLLWSVRENLTSTSTQPNGYEGKLYSFLGNFQVEEKFVHWGGCQIFLHIN